MLRYCLSSCTSSHTWCYATVRRLALLHRHDATLRPRTFLAFFETFVAFLLIGVGWGGVGWGGMITFICTSHRHVNATSKVAGHTLMSEDIKAMVNQWVFRQSLGPITPIAFLDELKRLLKQWGKKALKRCFAVVWVKAKIRNVKKHWVFS